MRDGWDRYWWEEITGPRSLAKSVTDTLTDSKSVVLFVPDDLPWRQQMRDVIENMFRDTSDDHDVSFDFVDVNEDYSDNNIEPGRFILNKYPNDGTYRTSSGKSIQDFIQESRILKNTVVWLKGFCLSKDAKEWLTFVSGFITNGNDHGHFVIEIPDTIGQIKIPKELAAISYRDHISRHDLRLFCANVLDREADRSLSGAKANYLSALISRLCDTDAEIGLSLIDASGLGGQTVRPALSDIAQYYHRRGDDIGSDHILAHVRNGNEDEISLRIWAAQIETLFPLIEIERINIISSLHEEIANFLQSSDEDIDNPYDMELGKLHYHGYHFIDDISLRDRISYLRDVRNKLAHRTCIDDAQIVQLLSD